MTNAIKSAYKKLNNSKAEVINAIDQDEKRTVQVNGFNAYPCGGTHIDNFELVGDLLIRNVKSAGKGKLAIGYNATVNLTLFKQKVDDEKKMLQSIAQLHRASMITNMVKSDDVNIVSVPDLQ